LNSAVMSAPNFCRPTPRWFQRKAESPPSNVITLLPGSKRASAFSDGVLANEGSASGAEIVSARSRFAPRHPRGRNHFRKGSVQNVMQLPDGSALRFTTAKYYTPSKQVIQGMA